MGTCRFQDSDQNLTVDLSLSSEPYSKFVFELNGTFNSPQSQPQDPVSWKRNFRTLELYPRGGEIEREVVKIQRKGAPSQGLMSVVGEAD